MSDPGAEECLAAMREELEGKDLTIEPEGDDDLEEELEGLEECEETAGETLAMPV
jgi:hypothetical protein